MLNKEKQDKQKGETALLPFLLEILSARERAALNYLLQIKNVLHVEKTGSSVTEPLSCPYGAIGKSHAT